MAKQSLAVTFTNKAARKMKTRVGLMVGHHLTKECRGLAHFHQSA